ncbi:MAG TPA: alpha/beta hydrolase [Rubrivivax sp.]
MTLDSIELQSGADPSASLIVLHGLGADGSDFVPVCEALRLGSVGPVRFVLPNAPERAVTINGGHVMRAWYDLLGTEFDRREDEAGLRQSQALVDALIARERERGVAANRIVLMGFSQGCAMTLMTGLRHPERLAGLVGLSGYLPLAPQSAAERHAANQATPVFLAHGRQDGVIPIGRASASREALQALGHPVEWHEYAMAHSVCMEEITDLNRWLLQVWA